MGVRIPPLAPGSPPNGSQPISEVKVSIKETSTWQRTLEVTVPREQVEAEERDVLKEYRQKVRVDGFRKGKAPDRVILQRHGSEIRTDAIEAVLPRVVGDALREREITPISPPMIQNLEYPDGGPLVIHATFEVMPEFEVKGYRGLKLEKWLRPVTEEDVDQALEGLRERTAELVPVERAAAFGDYLQADITECDELGTPILGQKSANRLLLVAEEGEGSDVGRQLAGIGKGEDRRVVIEHDAESPDAGQAGGAHRHVFLVQVSEVKEKRLPTLDDEYARGLGEFEDLADLRGHVREDLEEEVEREARRQMVGQAIDQLIRKNDIEVPSSLINRYLDGAVEEHRRGAGGQQVDEGLIRSQYKGLAQTQIRWQLMAMRIAEQESLETSEEEIRARTAQFAQGYNLDAEEAHRAFVKQGRIDRLRADIREEKVVDLILGEAKIKEKKIDLKRQKKEEAAASAAAQSAAPAPAATAPAAPGPSLIVGPSGEPAPRQDADKDEEGGSGLIIPGR